MIKFTKKKNEIKVLVHTMTLNCFQSAKQGGSFSENYHQFCFRSYIVQCDQRLLQVVLILRELKGRELGAVSNRELFN